MVPSNIPLPPSMPGFSCLLITLTKYFGKFVLILFFKSIDKT